MFGHNVILYVADWSVNGVFIVDLDFNLLWSSLVTVSTELCLNSNTVILKTQD